jgi:hypothetical protein
MWDTVNTSRGPNRGVCIEMPLVLSSKCKSFLQGLKAVVDQPVEQEFQDFV